MSSGCKQCGNPIGRLEVRVQIVEFRNCNDHDAERTIDAGVLCGAACAAHYFAMIVDADRYRPVEEPF